MSSTLAQVRLFDANPPVITTGGQSRLSNPYGVGYSSPLVPREPASYENLQSDAFTAPMSAALLEPASIQVTIEETLLTNNNFLIQTILPLQVTDNINPRWTKFVFKPYLPNKMPYYSVARFVKGETQSREAALVRVGLGFTLEQNFMATPLGQIFYLQHMKQISQAFLEQLQADAIIALLEADMWAADAASRRRDINGKAFVDQAKVIMEREVNLWNYMQKTENAWAQLNYWVDSHVALFTNEKLNTWIIDHRIDGFRKHVPRDQTDFYLFGPGNQNNLRTGVQYFTRDELGNTIYSTRGYRLDDRPEFNPLEGLQQTGEFYLGVDLPTLDYNTYTTRDRSISIYNEDLDAMAMLSLNDMIDNCQRFDAKGNLLSTNQLPKNIAGNVDDLDKDFLYHKINDIVVPKRYFGQLDRQHFTMRDKLNLGQSVCAALKMNMKSSQIGTMLKELASCVLAIAQTPVSSTDFSTWMQQGLLSTTNTTSSSTSAPPPVPTRSYPEFFRVTNNTIALGALGWRLPVTHATYRGFKEIERQVNTPSLQGDLRQVFSSKYLDIIQKYMPVFDTYIQTLDGMFPGCAFIDPQGSTTIAGANMYDVAFENIFLRETPFIPVALSAPAPLPDVPPANAKLLRDRIGLFNNIISATGIVLPPAFSTNDTLDHLVRYFFMYAVFVATERDKATGGTTYIDGVRVALNDFMQTALTDFTVAEVRSFVYLFTAPELSELRADILDFLAQSSAKQLVVSASIANDLPPAAQSGLPSDWRDIVNSISGYADRYNGNSTNINFLPLIANLMKNGGRSTSSTPVPTPTTTTYSATSMRRTGRSGSVGFTATASSSRAPVPTATASASYSYTPIDAQITEIKSTLTPAFREHYTEACQRFSNDPQYLVPVLMFLFTMITKFSVSASANYGFWHPFDYIIARPHMLYSTVSAIKTIPGSGTGNTYIGQMTANVANDNQTDETNVHIAGWTGAVVTGTNRTFTANNILVTKYHKGNGMGMITPNEYNPSQGVFGGPNDASLIVICQPRNEKYGKCFSLSGELSMTSPLGQTVAIRTSDAKSYTYSSAPFYNRVYGFNHWNWKGAVRGIQGKEKFVPNNIVYASLTLYWDQSTKKYSISTVNTGHWDTRLTGPAKGAQRVGIHALDDCNILSTTTQANLSCVY